MFDPFEMGIEFFEGLTAIDQAIVERAAEEPCRDCGGPLYRSDHPRKPRGGLLAMAGEAFGRRFNLCCGRDGCRHRAMPPSVRFLGRRVYLGAVVVVASAMALTAISVSAALRGTRLTGPAVDPGDGSALQSRHGEGTAVEVMVDEHGRAVEEKRSYGGGIRDRGRALGFVASLVVERTGSWYPCKARAVGDRADRDRGAIGPPCAQLGNRGRDWRRADPLGAWRRCRLRGCSRSRAVEPVSGCLRFRRTFGSTSRRNRSICGRATTACSPSSKAGT